jgi:hypothetical protein
LNCVEGIENAPRAFVGLLRGQAAGVPSICVTWVAAPADPPRSILGRFNSEQIAARTWPVQSNNVSVIELTYLMEPTVSLARPTI